MFWVCSHFVKINSSDDIGCNHVHISIELCVSKQKKSCIKTAEEFVYSTMRSDHSTSLLITFSDYFIMLLHFAASIDHMFTC
jgi:hypothetical protein